MEQQTPLLKKHMELGAKMIDFAGFSMPVWYKNIKDEHMAVRQNAGVFDISHMGALLLTGTDVEKNLQYLSCNDVTQAVPNKMIYSMVLNDDGGILDDIMLGHLNDNEWLVIVNASNMAKILAWFDEKKTGDITIQPLRDTHTLLAVQGPGSPEILATCFGKEVLDIPRFGNRYIQCLSGTALFMRTGYTGEDGFEILVPNSLAEALWTTVCEANVTPCGLGARDTLRLEFGLPLYGNELSETITPLQTRYRWVVKYDTDFIGKQALLAEKEKGIIWTTVGLVLDGKFIPRTGYEINEGGHICSGTLSPTLNQPIAMAMVMAEYKAPGTKLTVNIRKKAVHATVVSLPFIKNK